MLTSEPVPAEPTLARSRLSASQESAIFEAALQLVAEVGFDLASIDEIARRARASKATIYRRWKGKTELVFAALLRRAAGPRGMRSGASLREDLVRGMSGFCADATAQRDLVLGLIPVFRANPERTRVAREQLTELGEETAAELFQRAVERGELPALPPEIAKIVEVAEALVYHRLLMTGAPLDAAFVTYVVDRILLPLIHEQLAEAPRPAAQKGARAAPRAPRGRKPATLKR